MPPSIRQQRQALRRQRRQQRQAQRQGARSRSVSPHLSRRVRSSDLHSLDERQRRMAQAILSRRRQTQQLLEQSEKKGDDAAIAEKIEPNQEETFLEDKLAPKPTELSPIHESSPTEEASQEQ